MLFCMVRRVGFKEFDAEDGAVRLADGVVFAHLFVEEVVVAVEFLHEQTVGSFAVFALQECGGESVEGILQLLYPAEAFDEEEEREGATLHLAVIERHDVAVDGFVGVGDGCFGLRGFHQFAEAAPKRRQSKLGAMHSID